MPRQDAAASFSWSPPSEAAKKRGRLAWFAENVIRPTIEGAGRYADIEMAETQRLKQRREKLADVESERGWTAQKYGVETGVDTGVEVPEGAYVGTPFAGQESLLRPAARMRGLERRFGVAAKAAPVEPGFQQPIAEQIFGAGTPEATQAAPAVPVYRAPRVPQGETEADRALKAARAAWARKRAQEGPRPGPPDPRHVQVLQHASAQVEAHNRGLTTRRQQDLIGLAKGLPQEQQAAVLEALMSSQGGEIALTPDVLQTRAGQALAQKMAEPLPLKGEADVQRIARDIGALIPGFSFAPEAPSSREPTAKDFGLGQYAAYARAHAEWKRRYGARQP